MNESWTAVKYNLTHCNVKIKHNKIIFGNLGEHLINTNWLSLDESLFLTLIKDLKPGQASGLWVWGTHPYKRKTGSNYSNSDRGVTDKDICRIYPVIFPQLNKKKSTKAEARKQMMPICATVCVYVLELLWDFETMKEDWKDTWREIT